MRMLLSVLCCLLCLSVFAVAQHEHHQDFDPSEKVGTVHFPISCEAQSAKPFERGVALLHSFWYEQARKQFHEIEASDPNCAMAYWGDAMTYWHQIWEPASDEALKQGSALLQKSKSLNPPTERERDYIAALAEFFRDPQDQDHDARAQAYSDAMEKLYAKYPKDDEAGAFYALSLLASGPDRDPTLANERKAISLLDGLYARNPDHPGIPHYIIHSCDRPQLAPLGLNAARAYAKIAPASPHALHMPAHIFARLGLWQEDIQSNLASVAAAEKTHATMHEVHAMDFLNYAYLQTGQDDKAREIIARLNGIQKVEDMPEMSDHLVQLKAEFPATYALEMRDWKRAASLEIPSGADDRAAVITYWGRGIGAGHLRDAKAAQAALKDYNHAVDRLAKTKFAYMAKSMDTDRDEIAAWAAFADGKNVEAEKLIRAVADRQDSLGKPEVALPAREMLADMLLESNHPEQALGEYEQSMKIDPNRFNGLYGAATSAELLKQNEKAKEYYAKLLKNCEGAQSDRPELAKARERIREKVAAGGQ
jgi:tetratricopeptide (TPR) repeat protein